MNKCFSVIIVAAGKSTRMQGIKKQFLSINNIPVFIRSIKKFENIDNVKEIILVVSNQDVEYTNELLNKFEFNKVINVVVGGNTRQKSVLYGVLNTSQNIEYIAIHDSARPLVLEKDILNVFNDGLKYNASTLGVVSKDTMKIIDEKGFISNTLNREYVINIQTPQVFNKKLYLDSFNNLKKQDFTDDCQLIENAGHKVYVTMGSYSNIKITTPEDIDIAKNIIEKESLN